MRDYKFESIYPNKKVLSSSQFLSYERDPRQFFIEYVLGARRKPSKPMMIGLAFSELYADRNFDVASYLAENKIPRRIISLLRNAVVRFPICKDCEYELIGDFKGWKFRATLDGFAEPDIIENKTGQTEWTQERADTNDQITFQAWAYWKKYGVPPRKIMLNWVNTSASSKQMIVSYQTHRSIKQLKEFEKRVEIVIENIEGGNFTNLFTNLINQNYGKRNYSGGKNCRNF